ncbi:unnamed protein product [Hyaloperonospora brassicae]|uniref:DNA polymerase delta subunit 3 n=1 Tax=Hyaloperonospora brassicae TaxID=162125 RepID=A0AAV0UCC8_HYABA|nr:unnamed protein product [Hyaloperonospora brassicae]
MERCLEEIHSTVEDAREPISYRTLSIRSQASCSLSVEALTRYSAENSSVKALHLAVKRAVHHTHLKSETAAAMCDPRARVLSLTVSDQVKTNDDVLCHHIYAVYNKSKAVEGDADEAAAVATVCWAQERQTRNGVLDTLTRDAPLLSAAANALYGSDIQCAEATTRHDFGGDQGEETVSVFDANNASVKLNAMSIKPLLPPPPSSLSFFDKSSSKTGGTSKIRSKSREGKTLDMSNVLTVDSDNEDDKDGDDDDEEMDGPVFVKMKTNKRIISDDDDDDDMADVPCPKQTASPASTRNRNVKRKLNASPTPSKEPKQVQANEERRVHKSSEQHAKSDDEADGNSVEEPVVATKRRVLVSKTRINEQGYMVTESTYDEVELTPKEIEQEQRLARKKAEEKKKKKKAEAEADKATQEAKKRGGPPKQRDLRSFFSTK